MGNYNTKELTLKERINTYKNIPIKINDPFSIKISFSYKPTDIKQMTKSLNENITIAKKIINCYKPFVAFITPHEINLVWYSNLISSDYNKLLFKLSKFINDNGRVFTINTYTIPVNPEDDYPYIELYNFVIWRYMTHKIYMKQHFPDTSDNLGKLLKISIEEKYSKKYQCNYYRKKNIIEHDIDILDTDKRFKNSNEVESFNAKYNIITGEYYNNK